MSNRNPFFLKYYVLPSILLGFLLVCSYGQGEESTISDQFQVGVAAISADPQEFPVAVDGYFVPRMFTSVVEPLFVRSIMVQKGKEYFVFTTVDAVGVPFEFVDKVKKRINEKTGLDPARISISATHSHFVPGLRNKPFTNINKNYIALLADRIVESVSKAKESLQPALFGWTTARETRHVFCRRFLMDPENVGWDEPSAFTGIAKNIARMNPPKKNPYIVSRTGIPDQTIYILAFQTLDGKPLGILTNYSTHYAGKVKAISSDYFGVYARRIKEMLGAPDNFLAMMTNGTSGDTNCIDFLDANQPPFNYIVVGEHIAEKVCNAYSKIKFSDQVSLFAEQEMMTLKKRLPSEADVEFAKKFLKENAPKEDSKLTKDANVDLANWSKKSKIPVTTLVYAQKTIALAKEAPEATFPLQVIRINDFGIGTIPSEVYSFTGHDLRANAPETSVMIISLANGCNGYLPTTDQFSVGGYTTWRGTSLLEETAEPKIRGKLLSMLKDVYQKDKMNEK